MEARHKGHFSQIKQIVIWVVPDKIHTPHGGDFCCPKGRGVKIASAVPQSMDVQRGRDLKIVPSVVGMDLIWKHPFIK